jgi:hypothetical protein
LIINGVLSELTQPHHSKHTMQALHRTPMAVLQALPVHNRSTGLRPAAMPALPTRFSAPSLAPKQNRRSSTIVAAVDTEPPKTENENKPEIAKLADSVGLPTDEGLFGFKPFPEVWVGRLAMMGFLTSLLEEFWTGKGTLQQIGIATPSQPVTTLLIVLAGGATLFGTVNTLVKAQTGKLEPRTAERYKQFFGVVPDAEIKAEADKLKQRGDFTDPPDTAKDNQQIAESKAEGTPADRFLNLSGQEEEANQAATELKEQAQRAKEAATKGPSLSLAARADVVEQTSAQQGEWAYARQVEITNGRWAMLPS